MKNSEKAFSEVIHPDVAQGFPLRPGGFEEQDGWHGECETFNVNADLFNDK